MKFRALIGAISLIPFSCSYATTWAPTTVQDPIGGGECEVYEPASYGSYIYEWPSKYDGVYWPFTDHNWIWQCSGSGYLSFGNDFAELTEDEISQIKTYLNEPSSRLGGDLDRLESIYKLRNKDPRFWAWFYRVKAAILSAQADQARQEALPLLEKAVESLSPSFDLIQAYFVIGDYHRRFEEFDKAKDYFSRARAVQWVDEDGNSHIGSEYINKLIEERMRLIPE